MLDSEFSSDGQFTLTYEASDAVTLLTVTGDGREFGNEISRYPGYGEVERSTYFSGGVGKIGADAMGNVYVVSESWGEGVANGASYRTVRSVIMMQTPNGELSSVVLGHLSKFHYEKNGECIRRCAGFSGAKVLNDMAVQPDDRLITGWADSSVGFIIGEFGYGGLVPSRKAVIVASYAPVPPVKTE